MTTPLGAQLASFAAAIGARDWSGLRRTLADDASVTLLHTGEVLDADGFVAFNRDYPGDWHYAVSEVLDDGSRGALRARTTIGEEVFHVATFASADPATGALTDLVEVWTEAVAPHPTRSTPRSPA